MALTAAELVPLPELNEHGRGAFVHRGHPYAVFTLDGEVVVLDGRCSHRGGPLAQGLLRDDAVVCPWHGYRFDLRSGECLSAPEKAVRRYPVVGRNGRLFARVETALVRSWVQRLRARAHAARPFDGSH